MDDFTRKLTDYYNKFNEDKRLDRRHGQVEFFTNMHHIKKFIEPHCSLIDIGAGTGKYSIALKNYNVDVTAVELVRPNIGKMRKNDPELKIIEANAIDLHMINNKQFDFALLFGPMYHLQNINDRIKALNEAKRITKKIIFVSYLMNDYSIIEYAFKQGNYKNIKDKLSDDFHIIDNGALYFQSRIEDMDLLLKACNLKLVYRFASDGPSDYMRNYLNQMDEETFSGFLKYHLATCQRSELLGASSHVVDILQVDY